MANETSIFTQNIKSRFIKVMSLAVMSLLLFACDNKLDRAQDSTAQTIEALPDSGAHSAVDVVKIDVAMQEQPLTARYLSLAAQEFGEACSNVNKLQSLIQSFLSSPNEEQLEKAKLQWVTAHSSYSATKLFRTLNIKHPILDYSKIDPLQHSLNIRIDQSPLLAGYLDAVEGYPQSGYVFTPLAINKETLEKEHQFADPLYVTLGFHPIEILLWGGDSELPRKSTDFAPYSESSKPITEDDPLFYQVRRSQLLYQVTSLLTNDLAMQCKEWLPAQGYYPSQLIGLSAETQILYISDAVEQQLSEIQINNAKIKQATDNSDTEVLHSLLASSDQKDIEAQIGILKKLLESKEWKEKSEHEGLLKKITKSAKTLL